MAHLSYFPRTPLVAALSAVAILAACSKDNPDDLVASAKTYIAKNDPRAAIIQLKNALQKKPDSAEARFLLGQATLAAGDPVSAAIDLQRALDAGYPADKALPVLLDALLAQGKPDAVVRDYAGKRYDDPKLTAAVQTALASAYGALGQPEKSKAAIDAALAAAPDDTKAQLFQARLAAEQDRIDDGLAIVTKLLQKEPGNAEVWYAQGDLLWHGKGDDDGAQKAYRKAAELNPVHVPSRSALVALLLAHDDVKAAAPEIDALRKLPGQQVAAAFFDAQSAFQTGNIGRAHELVQQVLKAAPDSPSALQLDGAVALSMRSLVGAERSLTKALQLQPRLTMARRLLAQTYLRSGQPDKALGVLGPHLSAANPRPADLSLAGEAWLQKGDRVKAEGLFKRAMAGEAGADRTRTRTALALLELDKNRSEAALGELQAIAAADKGTYADLALVTVHLRHGDTKRALEAIGRLEAKAPDKPDAPYLRGTVLLQQNQRTGAREAFEKAVANDPVYIPAVAQLVALDLADNKPEQARARFEKVLATDKGNAGALLGLSALRERSGAKPDEVLQPLREAVKQNPGDATARLRLVDALLNQHEPKQALEAAQQATGALPDSIELLDALGRAQTATGNTEQAIGTFNKLASLAPQTPQPYMRLAAIALSQGNTELAARHLRRAIDITPNLVGAQQMLMGIELRNKRNAEALAIARKVQQQRPQELTGFMWEADIQAAQADAAGAVEIYRALFKRFQRTDPLVKMHVALLQLGRKAEADAATKSWLAQHPNDLAFHLYLGDVAIAHQEYEPAAERFRFVLKLQPDNVAALNNLAWVLARQGKPGAVEPARQALLLRPRTPTLMDTLAFALASEKQYDEAIKVQKDAIALSPDTPALKLTLARIYVDAGKKGEARTELQALQKLGDKFPGQPEVKRLLEKV